MTAHAQKSNDRGTNSIFWIGLILLAGIICVLWTSNPTPQSGTMKVASHVAAHQVVAKTPVPDVSHSPVLGWVVGAIFWLACAMFFVGLLFSPFLPKTKTKKNQPTDWSNKEWFDPQTSTWYEYQPWER